MSSHSELQTPQPPRIAQWLVALFLPADVAESVIGDLLEEFSALVIKSGVHFARTWYWRQSVNTIINAGATAFRSAPLLMLFAVAGGWWLIGFATRYSAYAMRTFLDAHRIYESHLNAYLFWLTFPMEIGRIILCVVVGACVAPIAKKKEMVAVTTLASVEIALFLAGTMALIAHGRQSFDWFLAMLPWNALCAVAIVAGGAIVRKRRHSTTVAV